MGVGHHYVTQHAVDRILERWPTAPDIPRKRLYQLIARSIERADEDNQIVHVPGGTYVPFSLGNDDGYLVMKRSAVITAVRSEWATEVKKYLEKKNGSIRK